MGQHCEGGIGADCWEIRACSPLPHPLKNKSHFTECSLQTVQEYALGTSY